ncbi:hypothetical protein [Ammoniphilus sp. YIM 78166]|nr:hypothetical protein [Ammoniphilus sp. YIM 78166]
MDEDPGGGCPMVSILYISKNKKGRPFDSSHGWNKQTKQERR